MKIFAVDLKKLLTNKPKCDKVKLSFKSRKTLYFFSKILDKKIKVCYNKDS